MKNLLLLLFLAVSPCASATVITGQLSPAYLSLGSNMQALYDLDNNGQYDLFMQILYAGPSNITLLMRGMNGTQFETDGNLNLIGYNSGAPLGANVYQDSGYVKSPFFPASTFRFVGFRLRIGNQMHCGYLQLTADYYQGIFHTFGFGYETNSAVCIVAGSTTSISGIAVGSPGGATPYQVSGTGQSLMVQAATGRPYRIEAYDNMGRLLCSKNNVAGTSQMRLAAGSQAYIILVVADMLEPEKVRLVKKVMLY